MYITYKDIEVQIKHTPESKDISFPKDKECTDIENSYEIATFVDNTIYKRIIQLQPYQTPKRTICFHSIRFNRTLLPKLQRKHLCTNMYWSPHKQTHCNTHTQYDS